MKVVGLYKITSPSGKIYIGQSRNIYKRWGKYCGKNFEQNQPPLALSIRKYGKKEHLFEIIHELPFDISQTVLNTYEEFYIEQYTHCGFKLLNIRPGGRMHNDFTSVSKKISNKLIGNKNNSGKKASVETRLKMRNTAIKNGNKIGEKNHNTTLTNEQVLEIFHSEGLQDKIALKYGIRRCTVSEIKTGSRWSKITGVKHVVKNKKLTTEVVIAIYKAPLYTVGLSKKYGVSSATISRIRNRVMYKKILNKL